MINGDKPVSEINPAHYRQHPSGVEAIEVCEDLDFCLGNALKYLFRAGLKTPKPSVDLRKAAWYFERASKRHNTTVRPTMSARRVLNFEPQHSLLWDAVHLVFFPMKTFDIPREALVELGARVASCAAEYEKEGR